jgi:hypothetical protein
MTNWELKDLKQHYQRIGKPLPPSLLRGRHVEPQNHTKRTEYKGDTGEVRKEAITPLKQYIVLPYKFPDLNDYQRACRAHWSKGHAMKKEWTEAVIREALAAKLKPMEKAHISITWIEKDERRDPDNIIFAKKFLFDGLVKAGVLSGDRWKNIDGITEDWKTGARYEVIVVLEERKE